MISLDLLTFSPCSVYQRGELNSNNTIYNNTIRYELNASLTRLITKVINHTLRININASKALYRPALPVSAVGRQIGRQIANNSMISQF
nr:MAG TPA: hypothetical protein [Caudoviricetes sp.]